MNRVRMKRHFIVPLIRLPRLFTLVGLTDTWIILIGAGWIFLASHSKRFADGNGLSVSIRKTSLLWFKNGTPRWRAANHWKSNRVFGAMTELIVRFCIEKCRSMMSTETS